MHYHFSIHLVYIILSHKQTNIQVVSYGEKKTLPKKYMILIFSFEFVATLWFPRVCLDLKGSL